MARHSRSRFGESPRATSRIGRELPEHHGALSSTLTRVVARPTVSQDVLTVKGERGGRLVRPNYQMTGSKNRITKLANSASIDLKTHQPVRRYFRSSGHSLSDR